MLQSNMQTPNNDSPLKNAHIVIIGASYGLGKALAIKFAKYTENLYLISRTIESIKDHDLQRLPQNIKKYNCNITNHKKLQQTLDKIPKIDILVNTVGQIVIGDLENLENSDISTTIDTNLTGIIMACKYSLEKLKQSKTPYIINVISTAGKTARAKETVYNASKFGLSGFTQALKLELAENSDTKHIKVIAVYPGGMNSLHFWQKYKNKSDIQKYLNPTDVAEHIINLIKTSFKTYPTEITIERVK